MGALYSAGVAGSGAFRRERREVLRTRLLDAARDITTESGWSSLTMSAVAGRAGISRQHVYNEIGTKAELGSALVGRETDGFVAVMCEQMRAHPADAVAGVMAAVREVLEYGARNALLTSILTVDEGAGESLLPLVTARPDVVRVRATAALHREIAALHPALAGVADLPRLVDGMVRLVIGHATSPGESTEPAVAQAGWLFRGFLDGAAGPGGAGVSAG